MRLCMFTPADSDLERGWPGRIDGDVVVQLAAQTLQSFFASGSKAREHAAYPLTELRLRAPVLEPPAIRIFDGEGAFAFANPSAVRSPGSEIARPGGRLDAAQRLVAVIGADGAIAGWTGLVEWRAPELAAPKDRDFALLLGPTVETEPQEGDFDWEAARGVAAAEPHQTARAPPTPPGRGPAGGQEKGGEWDAARVLAAANTRLRPGDLLAGPVLERHEAIESGGFVVGFDGIGELAAFVA